MLRWLPLEPAHLTSPCGRLVNVSPLTMRFAAVVEAMAEGERVHRWNRTRVPCLAPRDPSSSQFQPWNCRALKVARSNYAPQLGIDADYLRRAAAKLALAQAAQGLAIAQAGDPENINCTRLQELVANAESFKFANEGVSLKLIMKAKERLALSAATQVATVW